jgi:hypothetical protein
MSDTGRTDYWMTETLNCAAGWRRCQAITTQSEMTAIAAVALARRDAGILVLAHRDDLMEKFRRHVDKFNAAHSNLRIHLRELRDYAAVKRENPSLFKE